MVAESLRESGTHSRSECTTISPTPGPVARAMVAENGDGRAKKERRSRGHASSLLGTAEGTAGLGGLAHVTGFRGRLLVELVPGNAVGVRLAQPAPEVDEP